MSYVQSHKEETRVLIPGIRPEADKRNPGEETLKVDPVGPPPFLPFNLQLQGAKRD
jgi:hypothetical protein